VSYTWDLGDGTTGSGVNVAHSYGVAGSYEVTLTVTDDGGLSDSATQTIQVEEPVINQPPIAVINGPTSGLAGEVLSFDGSGSSDDGHIVSYAWDLGDGATGSGVNVAHSYSAAGSYEVTLTVTDDGGLSDSATHTIQINEII
jgi:PKD repeat protein